jgi:hypothetical protein
VQKIEMKRGKIMDYKLMTASCGLDCFNCLMYLANENEELRAKISKNMGIPFEQAVCKGCREEAGKPDFLNWTEPCNVYRCITKRKLDFCYQCSDFPCDNLHPYADRASEVPHNTKVFNLCLIKKMGLESWAKTKAKDVKHTYFKEKFGL